MKFVRAHIYGFGKWHDFQIGFQSNQLHVLYGENESGKSTLQQFILFMLFGLPPKKRAFYRSKTSGKMGGMLTIHEDEIGTYTIERIDEVRNGSVKCMLPNGEEADEEWLNNRLNGVNRQVYQSIYSFDALDLSALQTLKEEDLGEILLGVSLTGSTDIYAAEKRIDTKISELFKPSGKKPIINQQLDLLDDLTKKVQAYKDHEEKYNEKITDLNEVKGDIQKLEDKIQAGKKSLSKSEKLLQLLPSIHKLSSILDELESYPKAIPFPENGIERMEKIKEKMLPLVSERAIFNKNITSYNAKRSDLENSLMDSKKYNQVNQLLETKPTYHEYEKEIINLEKWLNEQEIRIKNDLKNINMNLEIEDLNDISLTYQTENTWIQLNEQKQQLQMEKDQIQQGEAIQVKQETELIRNVDSFKTNLMTPNHVEELSNRIANFYNKQDHVKEINQKADFDVYKNRKMKRSSNLLFGSIIVGVLFSIIGFFVGYDWGYGLALVSTVAGVIQWLFNKQSVKTMEQFITNQANSSDELHVTQAEKDEAEKLLAQHDACMRRIEIAEEKLQANKIEQIKLQERKQLVIQREKRMVEKINEQRNLYPILNAIDVSNWPALYHEIKYILKQKSELSNKLHHLSRAKENETQLRKHVMKFFQDENWEVDYQTMDSYFSLLEEKLKRHEESRGLVSQYGTWISTTQDQISSVDEKILVLEQELAKLLNLAEVDSEEKFYQTYTLLTEKNQAVKNKSELMDQLRMSLSVEQINELVKNELQSNTEIIGEQEQQQQNIDVAEQKLDEKRRELASINTELATMESSDDHSETMHRYYLEKAELANLIDKWSVLKSAKELLTETKNDYRDKHMMRIMDQTSDYFAVLTNHAYINVYAPANDKLMQVESADHLRFTVKELSQGTRDQLYIALRLSISEVMSDAHNMPFIIDDAFVHFDHVRAERMMKLITVIAKKRQVMLFTCKRNLHIHANDREITDLTESIRKI